MEPCPLAPRHNLNMGAITFPREEAAACTSVHLVLHGRESCRTSRGFWETEHVWQVEEIQGSPLSEGDLHCVLLCGLRAKHWAHQVILPAGLRLPEMMKITRCVLYPKPNRTHCASHKVSCQHTHNFREKVLARFITLPLTPWLMQIFEMSKQIPQVPVGRKSNPLLTSG